MVTKGAFGYIIGKKKRIMLVNDDADLLWQLLVREIYVLMKHYTTISAVQEAFESVKTAKANVKPKEQDKEKCKILPQWHNLTIALYPFTTYNSRQ